MLFSIDSYYEIMFADGEIVRFNVISHSSESFLLDRIQIIDTNMEKTVHELLNRDWLSINRFSRAEQTKEV